MDSFVSGSNFLFALKSYNISNFNFLVAIIDQSNHTYNIYSIPLSPTFFKDYCFTFFN